MMAAMSRDELLDALSRAYQEIDGLRDAHDQIATNYNTVSFTAEKRMEEVERLTRKAANADLALAAQTKQVHNLRAQLAEAHALLREVHGGMWPSNPLTIKIGSHLSASAEPSAPAERAEITLEQVLRAYEYAENHPHRYLRGTTNWCAAVAHSLNKQARATLERKP